MDSQFSKLASIDPHAKIGSGVQIGPFCVVGPEVCIGDGCRLENHVTVTGQATLGIANHIFPGAVIGEATHTSPASASVYIGDHNIIREGATINPGSTGTTIGNHNFLMACCHIGKSCQLGNRITVANGAVLGNRVVVQDHAAFSGRVVVNDDVTIGSYSFTSIGSHAVSDVPPFVIVEGHPSRPRSLNLVGLARHGFSPDAIRSLAIAYRIFFRSEMNRDQARNILRTAMQSEPRLQAFLNFMDSH